MTEALCWAHGRRKFYELADIAANKRRGKRAPPISPLALEAVTRIDVLREINGEATERRLAVRHERSAPLVADLEAWMRTERSALSRHAAVAKAMDYMLKRWDGFARFLDDGRICTTNNAAERALRGIALGRKSWLFAGSDRGGVRAAAMYTLIGTTKLNDVDPQAWLADVLNRIADLPQTRLHELLPWNWKGEQQQPWPHKPHSPPRRSWLSPPIQLGQDQYVAVLAGCILSDKELSTSFCPMLARKRSTQLANISALWRWAWAHHWEQTNQRPPYTRFQYRLCRPTKRPTETSRNSV